MEQNVEEREGKNDDTSEDQLDTTTTEKQEEGERDGEDSKASSSEEEKDEDKSEGKNDDPSEDQLDTEKHEAAESDAEDSKASSSDEEMNVEESEVQNDDPSENQLDTTDKQEEGESNGENSKAFSSDEEKDDDDSEGKNDNPSEHHLDTEKQGDKSDGEDSKASSSDDQESSSEEESDDDEGEAKVATSEDGHQLSEYELQRLERIRRNKEYLASLGLEKNKPRLEKQAPARKKREKVKPERRSSLSRTTKAKAVNYSDLPARGQKADSAEAQVKRPTGPRPKGDMNRADNKKGRPRMDRFIYVEFKRMEADVKQTLRTAKRNIREADVAYRFAKKKAERYQRKRKKELEAQKMQEGIRQEREAMGCTAREMLQQVDLRMYDIHSALSAYDQRFNRQESLAKFAEQQEAAKRKMEIIDAMDRFPKALKEAVRDLDLLLLERSPKDPPPPRRGTRKRKTLDSSETAEEPEPDAKKQAIESPDAMKEKLADGSWGGLAAAITAETMSSSAKVRADKLSPGGLDSPPATGKPKKKKRELVPRQVGGWVSPAFSKDIDRSWLEHDSAPKKFDASKYVPQIGDTVLYYPAGHRAFLKAHPDIIGKKTRNITRLTLWDRAKKEKAKLEKPPLEDASKKQPGKSSSKGKSSEKGTSEEADKKQHAKSSSEGNSTEKASTEDADKKQPAKNSPEGNSSEKGTSEEADKKKHAKSSSEGNSTEKASTENADEKQPAKNSPEGNSSEKGTSADADKNQPAKNSPEGKASKWWSDEWLTAVEGDLGRYPIVCRVEKTHAEFPPDPNSETKKVTKDGEGGVQVTWALQKDSQKKKKQAHPPLCLAVMLRPLTPVLPPSSEAGESDADSPELALAPNFYVVTFPSKVSPFIVPFSYAYRSSHSLPVGSTIRLSSKTEWRGKVKHYRSLDTKYGSSRLNDKLDSVRTLCTALKRGSNSFAKALEDSLASDSSATIPITDACAVIERFEALLDAYDVALGDDGILNEVNVKMMDLVRSSLPLWKEIVVESAVGKKVASSAWELTSVDAKTDAEAGPLRAITADIDVETGLVYAIDEPLRAKVEFTIEDFVKSTPDSSMFHPIVTDDVAPSYSCAVPSGMAFEKILRRLKPRKINDGVSRCYYRNVDSLIGDISAIADNCVLYNSPDSYVVETAMDVVPALKRLILQLASRHFKEKEAREKSVIERRQVILSQCNAPAMINGESDLTRSTPRSRAKSKRTTLQAPYVEPLHRSWIQNAEQDRSWMAQTIPGECSSSSMQSVLSGEQSESPLVCGWVPQSGDHILYSRSLHADFVKGHHPSLLTEQCLLPRFSGEGESVEPSVASNEGEATGSAAVRDDIEKRWLVGRIVWVRACFPRAKSKRDTDYENTFELASPILAVGIRFNYSWASNTIHTVYWRPCVFPNDAAVNNESLASARLHHTGSITHQEDNDDDESLKTRAPAQCGACHLRVDQSFLRPAWIPPTSDAVSNDNGESNGQLSPYIVPDSPLSTEIMFAQPKGLSREAIASIDRCLNVLKRRCLQEVSPDFIDPKFTKENVKKGWTPSTKSAKSLPTFDRLLAKGDSSGNDGSTRGIEKVDTHAVSLLADAHYLPTWTSALGGGSLEKTNRDGIAQSRSLHETLSPNPNLCLEMIQHRLQRGYYRDRSSVAHDIEEAYVSSVLLLLAKPASAKKGKAVSIRRIAKGASSKSMFSFPWDNSKKSKKSRSKKSVKKDEEQSKVSEAKKSTKLNVLSEDETMWVDKINLVRRLYGMALVCVTETPTMERIFGSAPPKKKAVLSSTNETLGERELVLREARTKLWHIYAGLQRDPCASRAANASIIPTIKVKVSFLGQNVPGEAMEVKPDDNSEASSVDTTKPILFESKDYEDSDALVSCFFGHPSRMSTCGRCSAYGRSMITCRVHKRHSLPDFDWIDTLRGTGGLNGLLHMIRTGERPQYLEQPKEPSALVEKSLSQTLPFANGSAVTEGVEDPNGEGQDEPNALEVLQKALTAVALANRLMEDAKKKSTTPIRLSEEFISSYFPVDPEDGHYSYCVICGLSGDVMCCEGCPNVAHPDCVNLPEVPEDDWYCSKCMQKPASKEDDTSSAVAKQDETPQTNQASEKPPPLSSSEQPTGPAPETDTSIDDDTTKLEEILNELKSLRVKPSKQDTETQNDEPGQKRVESSSAAALPPIAVGTEVKKSFGKLGEYVGSVIELPTADHPFYRVKYEDEDEEDYEEEELKNLLERTTEGRRSRAARETDTAESAANEDGGPSSPVKRRRGRPAGTARKQNEGAPPVARRRGRPPKQQVVAVDEPSPAPENEPKRRRGRPPKRLIDEPVRPTTKHRGRPAGTGKKRGRPRKEEATPEQSGEQPTTESPPRKRGRPRKRQV